MPELPDVEGFRRYMKRYADGRRIEAVDVPAPDQLRNTTAPALGRALKGRRFTDLDRHGKWLIASAAGRGEEGPLVLMHFGMTGGFNWAKRGEEVHRHDRVIFRMRGGELRYRNMRKLGGIWLARDEEEGERIRGRLGPDAMDLDRDGFEELLSGRRGALKPTLMNQRVLAGIGNELSDEILWQARLRPTRKIPTLKRREIGTLHRAMRKVIRDSNRVGHIPRREGWLTGAARAQSGGRTREAKCPRCERRLRREQIAGRTAWWCPRCQR